MLGLAAKGDRDAQACLRDTFIDEATGDNPVYSPSDLWAQAEIFARMAAEHGQPTDVAVLSSILLVRAKDAEEAERTEAAQTYNEQAYNLMALVIEGGDTDGIASIIGVVERVADHGDPTATAMLENIISKLTPEKAAAVTRRVAEESAQ